MIKLIWLSLRMRLASIILAIFSIAISVMLLLSVEKLSLSIKNHFSHSVSGIDLIVGARNNPLNIILSTVFHIGGSPNNISWNSYQQLADHENVDSVIPISLGDSHKGNVVVGTSKEFFETYRYGKSQNLAFNSGSAFNDLYDVVLGFQAAKNLGYKIDDPIIIAHGRTKVTTRKHTDKPFTAVGILAPTGTEVDRSLFISLEAMTAIHLGWQQGIPLTQDQFTPERTRQLDLTPKTITAAYISLKNRRDILNMQRWVNNYRKEPLSAVIPGFALSDLWRITGHVTDILTIISIMVLLATLIGLAAILLATLKDRRMEMAILRSLGASPFHIFFLLLFESFFITLCAIMVGTGLTYLALVIASPILLNEFGVFISITGLSLKNLLWLGYIIIASLMIALIPSIRAYKMTLNDGLSQHY